MHDNPAELQLITLNAWGGRRLGSLCEFLDLHAFFTDIFCFQEVFDAPQQMLDARHPDETLRGDQFSKMCDALREFHGIFAHHDNDPTRMSLAMFTKDTANAWKSGDRIIHRPAIPKEHGSAVFSSRKLQYVTVLLNGRAVTVVNYHGLWDGGHKGDTPERLRQSNSLRTFLDTLEEPYILCGDLNLDPDTESVRILADGNRDLVAEYGVRSTRTRLYRHYTDPAYSNSADYVFTSPGIDVLDFNVMSDVASDHSPLHIVFAEAESAPSRGVFACA